MPTNSQQQDRKRCFSLLFFCVISSECSTHIHNVFDSLSHFKLIFFLVTAKDKNNSSRQWNAWPVYKRIVFTLMATNLKCWFEIWLRNVITIGLICRRIKCMDQNLLFTYEQRDERTPNKTNTNATILSTIFQRERNHTQKDLQFLFFFFFQIDFTARTIYESIDWRYSQLDW